MHNWLYLDLFILIHQVNYVKLRLVSLISGQIRDKLSYGNAPSVLQSPMKSRKNPQIQVIDSPQF